MANARQIAETFGLYFVRLRGKTRPKVSQQEVADYAGVSQQYISLIERTAGTSEEPEVDWEVAVKMAECVGGTKEEALKAHGRDPNSPKFTGRPVPSDSTVLRPGDTAYLYSPDGKKVTVTDELMKRLLLESELQQGPE